MDRRRREQQLVFYWRIHLSVHHVVGFNQYADVVSLPLAALADPLFMLTTHFDNAIGPWSFDLLRSPEPGCTNAFCTL
jgi:hypothetical protein